MVETIDLCTSDEEEENTPVQQSSGSRAAAALGKRKAEAPQREAKRFAQDDEDSSDVEEIAPPPPQAPAAATNGSSSSAGVTEEDEDEDVTFVGRTGALALADFPHARENCVSVRFAAGQEHKHCANCYCYCCDQPANECNDWRAHCKASHADPKWRRLREQLAAAKSTPAAAAGGGGSSAGAGLPPLPAAPPLAGLVGPSPSPSWSCERVLRETQQVWPVEAPAPAGLLETVQLKPYQKQCLAFMLSVERSTDPQIEGRRYDECAGFEIAGGGFDGGFAVRGGWLASEVGMGKTMCAISLILANPLAGGSTLPKGSALQVKGGQAEQTTWGVTLVLAPPALLGQWMDEIRKFAPQLKVTNIHSSGKGRDVDVARADVLLCTPTTHAREAANRPIHRLIVDEAHAIGQPHTKTVRKLCTIGARNVWLLSGTPLSSSIDELKTGAKILGHIGHGLQLFESPKRSARYVDAELVARLKKVMIRHSKAMRIGGAVALALPEADSRTEWLTMTPLERRLYEKAVANQPFKREWTCSGAKVATLEMQIGTRRAACSNVYTKGRAFHRFSPSRSFLAEAGAFSQAEVESICHFKDFEPIQRLHRAFIPNSNTSGDWVAQRYSLGNHREYLPDPDKCTKLSALRADLRALRSADPSMHAVVFTHVAVTHLAVVAMLRADDFHVCEFSGATKVEERHQTIRDFQASGEARQRVAKVFVITMRTGAVGVTLTAATRVYLMEPSLDPAMEVQAAGRIHRLGQDKEVLIKRFAFRDSLESNICALHDQMKMGPSSGVGVTDGVLPAAAIHILGRKHAPTPSPPAAGSAVSS